MRLLAAEPSECLFPCRKCGRGRKESLKQNLADHLWFDRLIDQPGDARNGGWVDAYREQGKAGDLVRSQARHFQSYECTHRMTSKAYVENSKVIHEFQQAFSISADGCAGFGMRVTMTGKIGGNDPQPVQAAQGTRPGKVAGASAVQQHHRRIINPGRAGFEVADPIAEWH